MLGEPVSVDILIVHMHSEQLSVSIPIFHNIGEQISVDILILTRLVSKYLYISL